MTVPRISLIVAMGDNRVIGRDNALPWHLPADLQHFKATTMGAPILMGRRTFEAIGRALPGRRNLVLTRSPDYQAAGAETHRSLAAAIAACRVEPEVFVIGGAEVFAAALPHAKRLWLTRVHGAPAGDTFFPAFETGEDWQRVWNQEHPADERHTYAFTFERWERAGPSAPV